MHAPAARARRDLGFDELIRRLTTLLISEKRASELVDAPTKYDYGGMMDAPIQLICGQACPARAALDARADSVALISALLDVPDKIVERTKEFRRSLS